jgi:O-succinylbenzoate synthase
MLVRGESGWAEFSPFPEYGPDEAASWLAAAIEAATRGFPPPQRDRIPVNATVPAVSAERAAEIVRSSGCTTAKVKVAEAGQTLADDLERVAAVRDVLGADGRVRIDANGGWSTDEAVIAIGLLDEFELEYVEQPVADVADLADVRRRVDVRIAADESIRRADDPLRVRDLEAADIAVLKVQPLGGVRSCLRLAEQIGIPVVVSSAVETSVGLSAGVALAAALPELPFACGLATSSLLAADVTSEPLVPRDGFLEVRRCDADLLDDVIADDETDAQWQERLREVQDYL